MRNGHHPETPPDGSGQTSVALAAEIRRTHTLLDTASTRVAVLRRSDDRGSAVPPGRFTSPPPSWALRS